MASTNSASTKETLLKEIADNLGQQALTTVQPTTVVGSAPANPGKPTTKNFCATQRAVPRNLRGGASNIMVGLKSECPRWTPGSVINWAAWENGFDTRDDASYAAKHLALATEKWNQSKIGISFQWVADAKNATFVLCHGGDRGSTLAQSFFPNDNDLNFFLVYSGAFVGAWKENLWKIFTHELGHVMGLRHEFAMYPYDDGTTREDFAVQIGPPNSDSVMNYTGLPPEIQQSDIKSAQMFYGMKKEAGKDTMVGLTVLRDYDPM